MKKALLIISIACLYACNSTKYLQPCQSDAVESLGKAMTTVGNKLPETYAKIYKYLDDNRMLSTLAIIGSDSLYIKTADLKADTCSKLPAKKKDSCFNVIRYKDSVYAVFSNFLKQRSDSLANQSAREQTSLISRRAGWLLSVKITELLKVIANPDYAKAFKTNKDGISGGFDSLFAKYNLFASHQVSASNGVVLTKLVVAIGTHKIKKRQKEYFKEAIDTGAPVMRLLLREIIEVDIPAYNTDLESLKSSYADSYQRYATMLSNKKIDIEQSQKILTELERVKKDIIFMEHIGQSLEVLAVQANALLDALELSLNQKVDCNTLFQLITKIDLAAADLETYSSFLK